ncbi:class I SAM-dependent methyltransferase [Streptomyces sp. NPDC098085]|uniref:class I SAM-dependent methyltransferase n=1 Tax=Streptomyces sp. NPDC098085 TaxID=3366094 RepID=UPI00380D3C4C
MLGRGAGHGHGTLYFAREGLTVRAADFSATGLQQLQEPARAQDIDQRVTTAAHDVRDPLPLPYTSIDAVFAHVLLRMDLSTKEIHSLVGEIRRVLRPGSTFVYTIRHTGDARYGTGTGTGIAHGDAIVVVLTIARQARNVMKPFPGWGKGFVSERWEGLASAFPRRKWGVFQRTRGSAEGSPKAASC